MLAFSAILDFLLHLLGDDTARAEFDRDPQGTLDRAGLDGVTAQDIRDARLQLADSGAVRATDEHRGTAYHHHGDDPVHEIGHTARHYAADEHATNHDPAVVDHPSTFVSIDDRDTLFFQSISDDDVTVTDNSVSVADSFNTDNSDDDLVAIQDNDTTVSDDDVTVNAQDSFNTADSFNEDNDLVAIQDNDVNGGDETLDVDVDAPAADPTADALDDAAADDPGTDDPSTDDPSPDDPPVDDPPADDPPADDPAADDPGADDPDADPGADHALAV